MSQEYKEKIGIPENHDLVQTDTKWEQRKGQDTDTYWYEEVDEEGNVVAKYVVKDFNLSTFWQKYLLRQSRLNANA